MRNRLIHNVRNKCVDVFRIVDIRNLYDFQRLTTAVDFIDSLRRECCKEIFEIRKLHEITPSFQ